MAKKWFVKLLKAKSKYYDPEREEFPIRGVRNRVPLERSQRPE